MGGYYGLFDSVLNSFYGGYDWYGGFYGNGAASGVVFNGNPPYTVSDFLAMYPKFFGPASPLTGTLTAGSNQVLNLSSFVGVAPGQLVAGAGVAPGSTVVNATPYPLTLTGNIAAGSPTVTAYTVTSQTATVLAVGQPIQGYGIPSGTTVLALPGPTITLSVNATQTTIGEALTVPPFLALTAAATAPGAASLSVYQTPLMPLAAMQVYVNLAQASIMQARYQEAWTLAMALFVAHYCTMYLRSEAGPNATAQQVATSGLEKGLMASKSAGDVSTSVQALGLDGYGAWQQTTYGSQLVSLAKGAGRGPIWVR